jgi:hypothetical protein
MIASGIEQTISIKGAIGMSNKFFDVVVAKEYEVKQSGAVTRRTAWNRVGRAWISRAGDSLSFEIYLIPNQRYVINLKDRQQEPAGQTNDQFSEEV